MVRGGGALSVQVVGMEDVGESQPSSGAMRKDRRQQRHSPYQSRPATSSTSVVQRLTTQARPGTSSAQLPVPVLPGPLTRSGESTFGLSGLSLEVAQQGPVSSRTRRWEAAFAPTMNLPDTVQWMGQGAASVKPRAGSSSRKNVQSNRPSRHFAKLRPIEPSRTTLTVTGPPAKPNGCSQLHYPETRAKSWPSGAQDGEGWLIDERMVKQYVSGMVAPSQRQTGQLIPSASERRSSHPASGMSDNKKKIYGCNTNPPRRGFGVPNLLQSNTRCCM